MGRSQHFPVPDLSSFLFPSPSLLRSGPSYSYLGSDVSSAGAQPRPTMHCIRKTSYRSRVSNTSRVFNRSQGQRGLLLEVLRYNVNVNVKTLITRKLCYRKDDRAMTPIYGCPKNFRDSLTMPTATFPNFFHGLLLWLALWMCVQNLKFVALPVPEIIWGTQKIWAVLDSWISPRSLLPKIFNGL